MAATASSGPTRLYVKGVVSSFKRSKRNQVSHTNILVLEGVHDKKAADFYLGKRVAYIYKAKTERNGSKFRVIWGRITRAHGTNGSVRAKFRVNLPPKALGAAVRVMLYPSHI
jgi:large subunit ribosomal protein L35Ae